MDKVLGRKAYGSIPHLKGSRTGTGEHIINPGQQRMCEFSLSNRALNVTVEEKLDGSCLAVAKTSNGVVGVGRAGYLVTDSPYPAIRLFDQWLDMYRAEFDRVLKVGQRVVGEWMVQAVGTKYNMPHLPFVPFDVMEEDVRYPVEKRNDIFIDLMARMNGLKWPHAYAEKPTEISVIKDAIHIVRADGKSVCPHGARESCEGAVWRVETKRGEVLLLAKYVVENKVDGQYFPETKGGPIVTNSWIDRRFPHKLYSENGLLKV